ncbi:CaiB/BaiF CoA-transferase family protein [Saccharopolyspora sp. SCSIO 74807]|uniref:CaiB/BaiF CoA transferase family protein n=1 Tax=Saccharopolyspora sp. SCSIO 74807 TaxID=3118084 RepID=UPI0030D1C96F
MKVIEIGSIGPGPFCAMMLADLGADIIRVDRVAGAELVGPSADFRTEVLNRGRRSVGIDLKDAAGRELVLGLVERADALIEGFRPGVAERLGIGPQECSERNPRLVYGRMTGFGQEGPLARTVGHDLNYVAQSGVLSLIGRAGQPPTPPLSLVGDFGGGGMVLALGILAALWETRRSGAGQVIDAAMCDGAALLGAAFHGFARTGAWNPARGTNLVDSGAPFYDVYLTADERWIAVAALEPRFYAELLAVLGFDAASLPEQHDRSQWPRLKELFADAIRARTRDEWVEAARGRDACLTAVLDVEEAAEDEHNRARGGFVEVDGLTQPAPAPRFSRTPARVDSPPPLPGEHTRSALADWGVSQDAVASLVEAGVLSSISEPTPSSADADRLEP